MVFVRLFAWFLVLLAVILACSALLASVSETLVPSPTGHTMCTFTFIGGGDRFVRCGELAATPVGSLWFQFDAGSLNLVQAFIERYLTPSLWHGAVAPFLLLPFLEAALYLSAGFLIVAGALFLLVSRNRKRKLRVTL